MDLRHPSHRILRQAGHSPGTVLERAAIGPIPGSLVIAAGVLFHGGWAVFAIITLRMETASRRERKTLIAMG
jgi:hypothetical protein